MTDRADNGIDGVKFAASAAAPNILPFFHAELGNTRDEIRSWELHDTVIINRLRIGHTRLTHFYLLSGDDQPTCNTYGLPFTVYHILLECSNLNVIRQDISLSTL